MLRNLLVAFDGHDRLYGIRYTQFEGSQQTISSALPYSQRTHYSRRPARGLHGNCKLEDRRAFKVRGTLARQVDEIPAVGVPTALLVHLISQIARFAPPGLSPSR